MEPEKKPAVKKSKKAPSVFDYLRFGESYTSLILGIVVVIIGTVLLLSLVRTRNTPGPRTEGQFSVQTDDEVNNATRSAMAQEKGVVLKATDSKPTDVPKPTNTPIPTRKPTVVPTATSKPKAVVKISTRPTATPTKKAVAQPTPTPKKDVAKNSTTVQGGTYVVKTGDSLWTIAEATYKSGYNWVDIARSNKLSNPDSLENGQKLTLPKVEQKNISSENKGSEVGALSESGVSQAEKITADKYMIKSGDTLWEIAVRAYGDGFQWTRLYSANKIANPDLIFTGDNLTIPRK